MNRTIIAGWEGFQNSMFHHGALLRSIIPSEGSPGAWQRLECDDVNLEIMRDRMFFVFRDSNCGDLRGLEVARLAREFAETIDEHVKSLTKKVEKRNGR
jgi:hypothetical protein